ncbi:MAG TPA: TonB-dependent receptor, partial [Thermoanaerobaculia bacterium]
MRRTGQSLLLVVVCLAMVSITASTALGQGVQTGTLTGTVKLPDGSGLPGVNVTVSSPAMQGTRTQVTGSGGDYVFKFLPPGDYKVDFEISGMKTVTRYASLAVGGSAVADATMSPSATAEVTVLGNAEEVDKTTVHSSTYDSKEINVLPIGRRIDQIVTLAPNVTDNTLNGGVQISGALSYDNVWLVDGVDINDNLFGTSTNNLVIEDAVQETKVLTSSVSAEYGRFSGGVINAVTKTGGNDFHGSARIDLNNDDWQALTPFEEQNGITHPNNTNEIYSGTIGGKFITDKLWFFGAGRYFKTSNQDTFDITGETFDASDEEPRYEAKLTANLFQNHTLQGTYTHSKESLVQKPLGIAIEASTLVQPEYPTDLIVGTYNGVLTPNLFASLQYSRKKFQFAGYGGTGTDVQLDSPRICWTFPGAGDGCEFGRPYFDATDPEDRDNNQWAGSLSYFLGTQKLGSHDIKGGFEAFNSISRGGNSQTSTGFTFYQDYKIDANGNPIFDSNHQLIPTWSNENSGLEIQWFASRGAEANIRTTSFYLNDIWRFGQLTANLGLRYEKVKGHGPEGTVTADSDSIVPRLSVAYDVLNDGRYTVSGSYAEYSGGYNPIAFNQITNVGNPSYVYYYYAGPSGEGYNFAPGYDPNNYLLAGGAFPTRNVFLESGLHSPRTKEWTGSIGGQILPNTYA